MVWDQMEGCQSWAQIKNLMTSKSEKCDTAASHLKHVNYEQAWISSSATSQTCAPTAQLGGGGWGGDANSIFYICLVTQPYDISAPLESRSQYHVTASLSLSQRSAFLFFKMKSWRFNFLSFKKRFVYSLEHHMTHKSKVGERIWGMGEEQKVYFFPPNILPKLESKTLFSRIKEKNKYADNVAFYSVHLLYFFTFSTFISTKSSFALEMIPFFFWTTYLGGASINTFIFMDFSLENNSCSINDYVGTFLSGIPGRG